MCQRVTSSGNTMNSFQNSKLFQNNKNVGISEINNVYKNWIAKRKRYITMFVFKLK